MNNKILFCKKLPCSIYRNVKNFPYTFFLPAKKRKFFEYHNYIPNKRHVFGLLNLIG